MSEPLFIQEGSAGAWRPWFAWFPVWVSDEAWQYKLQKRVWFRTILRRKFHCATWFMTGGMWFWQFRDKGDDR